MPGTVWDGADVVDWPRVRPPGRVAEEAPKRDEDCCWACWGWVVLPPLDNN